MIIPNLSEDKILEELVVDRQIVANEAKKIAKKRVARLQKEGRDGINEDNELQLEIRTKNADRKASYATKNFYFNCDKLSEFGSFSTVIFPAFA